MNLKIFNDHIDDSIAKTLDGTLAQAAGATGSDIGRVSAYVARKLRAFKTAVNGGEFCVDRLREEIEDVVVAQKLVRSPAWQVKAEFAYAGALRPLTMPPFVDG